MRVTCLLLTVACLITALTLTAQTISLSVKNTSIQKVFTLIEKQADVSFFYRVESLKKANKVSVQVSNASLKKVLELCFKNQPLFYQIIDKTIVVKESLITSSEITPLPRQAAPPSVIKLDGRIVTTMGEPVEMATVTIKGTKKATHSNADGEFSLNIENKNAVLVITSVAIEPVEVPVGNRTNLTVIANSNVSSLDPVQMIGYGQTTRRFNTGNVTTIKSEEIEKQPVTNVLAALEGLVPGLLVIQNTGMPGGSYEVNLRGISSLQANSDPLFIVNGVPYPAGTFALNNDAKRGGNALNILNIGDIERVEVLKDADATAIYGSRGGNGVILITTKKGRPGQTTVSMNMYTGVGKVTRGIKLLNLHQYMEMRMESLKNDSSAINLTDNSINGVWDTTRSTDWQKELLGRTANTTDVQLSLSGGTASSAGSSAFLVNGTYHRETTVMPTAGADQHYSLHFNYSNMSLKKKFKTELSGSYQAGVDDLPAIDFKEYLPLLIPHQPSSYLPNGTLNPDPSIPFNPYKKLQELYKLNTSNLVSNLKVSWTPIKGLELSASLGYHILSLNEFYGIPTTAIGIGHSSRAEYGSNNSQTSIIEPQAFYQANLKKKGKFAALIGSTYQKTVSSYQKLHAVGFSNDALLRDPDAAANTYIEGYSSSNYKYLGTFSRLSYNLDNKYVFNLTGRIDGTSRFGPGKQFRPFGAAGAAWIFSEEKPIKNLKWMNLAKLRGSFGFIGNSDIADYAFLDTYIPLPDYGVYQGVLPVVPNRLYNRDLGWELKKSLEVALELQLFKSRISMSLSAYQNRNSQQLLNNTIPTLTGFGSVLENSDAAVENKGIELVFGGIPISSANFSWNLNANVSFQKNTLLRYNGLENSKYVLVAGQSISSLKVYQFGGVDRQEGTYFFIDRNGNAATSLVEKDATRVINTDPRSYGSITNSFGYKGILLDINCMFLVRRGRNVLGQVTNVPGGHSNNQPVEVTDRWQKPGQIANVAKYSENASAYVLQEYFLNSSAAFSDASYLRIRNVSVSYRFNSSFLKKVHLQNLRFYLHGQNLFTFSKYRNLDPENVNHNSISMPPLRVMTAGFQITL